MNSLIVEKSGDDDTFSTDPSMQVGPDVASLPGLTVINNLASALNAIDTIVFQGEGSPTDNKESHFARFRAIKAEYENLLVQRPTFNPARPAAMNPVMRRPATSEERVYIDFPHAARVLDLANAIYNQMLRMLVQAYARLKPSLIAKGLLIEGAMELMKIFAAMGTYLTTVPASESIPGINAGVSFAILRSTEPLAEGRNEWFIIRERLNDLADAVRSLSANVPEMKPEAIRLTGLAQKFLNN